MNKILLISSLGLFLGSAVACLGSAESGNNGTVNGSIEGSVRDPTVRWMALWTVLQMVQPMARPMVPLMVPRMVLLMAPRMVLLMAPRMVLLMAPRMVLLMAPRMVHRCTLTCADWSKLNPDTCECEETDDCLEEDDNCVWPGHAFSTNRCICARVPLCVNNTTIYMPPACECVEGRGYFEGGSNDRLGCWSYTLCREQ